MNCSVKYIIPITLNTAFLLFWALFVCVWFMLRDQIDFLSCVQFEWHCYSIYFQTLPCAGHGFVSFTVFSSFIYTAWMKRMIIHESLYSILGLHMETLHEIFIWMEYLQLTDECAATDI